MLSGRGAVESAAAMAVVVSLNEPDEIVKMLLKPLSLEIVNYEEQSRQMMPSELKRINS